MNRQFIDGETGDPVPREAQVKGFEIRTTNIMIDPEEVAAVIPESNTTLEIEAFIPCSDVDDVYFDKPYTSRRPIKFRKMPSPPCETACGSQNRCYRANGSLSPDADRPHPASSRPDRPEAAILANSQNGRRIHVRCDSSRALDYPSAFSSAR
ncbi:hypothetical protein ACVJBD_006029 [Rhizobium mongolense]